QHVGSARQDVIGKDFRLDLCSEALGKSTEEGRGQGFAGGKIRNSILTLLDFVQAREGAIASTPINKHCFGEREFAIGSDVDVSFHDSHLEMIHWSLPGIRSITRLAAAMVWQATPNTWKAPQTLCLSVGSNGMIRLGS